MRRPVKYTDPLFAPVLTGWFATSAFFSFRCSPGVPPTLRDGTDPLLGGHGAALDGHSLSVGGAI